MSFYSCSLLSKEIETIKGLNWIEDLEWRADDKLSQILNEQIDSILFHNEDIKWGVGIMAKHIAYLNFRLIGRLNGLTNSGVTRGRKYADFC